MQLITVAMFIFFIFKPNADFRGAGNYYQLYTSYHQALDSYNNKEIKKARDIFEFVINSDDKNFYWESYCYLAKIYLSNGEKDSALSILKKGIKKGAVNWNAKNEYRRFIQAINDNHPFELKDCYSFNKEENDLIVDDFPDVRAKPLIGFRKYREKLKSFLKIFGKDKNVHLEVSIDSKGRVARIKILSFELNAEKRKKLKKFYDYVFSAGWKPTQRRGKNIAFVYLLGLK